MTADQLTGIINLVVAAEKAGAVAVRDVLDFFEQKGADAQQIADNRAMLASDIEDIEHELGAKTATGG